MKEFGIKFAGVNMIDIPFEKLHRAESMHQIGEWLDKEMPNLPLPETQRWSLGYAQDGSYRVGVRFLNETDATLFLLRWES